MGVWEAYARTTPTHPGFYEAEPVQGMRVEKIVELCVGTVLDVGAADGFVASQIRDKGHWVTVVDISNTRVARCWDTYKIRGYVADAADLPFQDGAFDTVVLAEVLEHMENPGPALAEAARVARQRVIVTLPTRGWADPTHEWRVRCDVLSDEAQMSGDPTKGQQVVLTLDRGRCWPPEYYQTDEAWKALFDA